MRGLYRWRKRRRLRGAALRLGVLLSLTLSVATGAYAQDCETVLRGRVYDEHDDQPLEAATVYLEGTGVGAYTDVDGRYALVGPCGKTDTLLVDHIGCEPLRRGVMLAGAPIELDLQLEHHTELLSGIEVHGHRNQSSAADIGGTLSGEQLDATAGADLARVAEGLPGVRTLSTGAGIGRPLVDGLGGSRLQIVQGGMALATQDWGRRARPRGRPLRYGERAVGARRGHRPLRRRHHGRDARAR